RAYVMGERGAKNEPATPADVAQMAAIVKQAIAAGALGFSTSRTIVHRAITGEPVPGTFAAEDELFGIGRALGELGAGLFELAPAGALGAGPAGPAPRARSAARSPSPSTRTTSTRTGGGSCCAWWTTPAPTAPGSARRWARARPRSRSGTRPSTPSRSVPATRAGGGG